MSLSLVLPFCDGLAQLLAFVCSLRGCVRRFSARRELGGGAASAARHELPPQPLALTLALSQAWGVGEQCLTAEGRFARLTALE